jgi:hypothetical protein
MCERQGVFVKQSQEFGCKALGFLVATFAPVVA